MEKSFHCQDSEGKYLSTPKESPQGYDAVAVGQRLKAAIKKAGTTQKAVGKAISKSEKIVGHWCKGEYVPTLEDAAAMATLLGTNLNTLVFGMPQVVSIPFWGSASAGLGYENGHAYPEWFLKIDPQIIRQQFHANPETTHLAQVEGESMSPQFADGDLIFVDTSDIEPRRGIYVIRIGSQCMVKHVGKTNNGLRVTSINPEYRDSDHTYPAASEVEEIAIIGRVKGKIARV